MKDFEFNEHGICTNPNVTKVLEEKNFNAEVRCSFHNGKWHYGYSWNNTLKGYSGASCGAGISLNENTFDTEDEAKRYAVLHNIIPAIENIRKEIISYSDIEYDEDGNVIKTCVSDKLKTCDGYIDKCRIFIEDTYQLSLF